jgi:hypothetical protein
MEHGRPSILRTRRAQLPVRLRHFTSTTRHAREIRPPSAPRRGGMWPACSSTAMSATPRTPSHGGRASAASRLRAAPHRQQIRHRNRDPTWMLGMIGDKSGDLRVGRGQRCATPPVRREPEAVRVQRLHLPPLGTVCCLGCLEGAAHLVRRTSTGRTDHSLIARSSLEAEPAREAGVRHPVGRPCRLWGRNRQLAISDAPPALRPALLLETLCHRNSTLDPHAITRVARGDPTSVRARAQGGVQRTDWSDAALRELVPEVPELVDGNQPTTICTELTRALSPVHQTGRQSRFASVCRLGQENAPL